MREQRASKTYVDTRFPCVLCRSAVSLCVASRAVSQLHWSDVDEEAVMVAHAASDNDAEQNQVGLIHRSAIVDVACRQVQ